MKNLLQKQVEEQKFQNAISYVQQSAHGIKKLNSNELAHLNQLLTAQEEEPWRFEPVQVQIPSGQIHSFNVISNPLARARDIISDSIQMAGNQRVLEAAGYLYSQLVLEHLFRDANRRTAVLATVWLLKSNGYDINPQDLLKIPIGNLREAMDKARLNRNIENLAKK